MQLGEMKGNAMLIEAASILEKLVEVAWDSERPSRARGGMHSILHL